jgi:hypothetical protein
MQGARRGASPRPKIGLIGQIKGPLHVTDLHLARLCCGVVHSNVAGPSRGTRSLSRLLHAAVPFRPLCPGSASRRSKSRWGLKLMSRMSLRGQSRRLTVRVAVAVVATSLGLAGCQANPEPPPLEDAASTPSPSATPSTAAPSMPPEAEGTSKAAAKAFVRHYVDLVNYAMKSGDTRQLSDLSASTCQACRAITDRIDEVYDNGGRLEGRGWRVDALTYYAHAGGPGERLVAAGIRIAPQTAYLPSTRPSPSRASRGNLDFTLARESTGWRVVVLEATQ